MATILLVASEAMEFRGLTRRAGGKRLGWPVAFACEAVVGSDRLLMAADGAGPRPAAGVVAEAARWERLDAVVSVGYCGALDPALRAGEVVSADVVLDPGTGEKFPSGGLRTARQHVKGSIISVDRVIQTKNEKRELRALGGIAVEMEAAGAARQARGLGLPFGCVRVVTDEAEEGFSIDYNSIRDAEGRFRRLRAVGLGLGHPLRSIPEFMKIYRRGRLASEALGDFLAGSQFQF